MMILHLVKGHRLCTLESTGIRTIEYKPGTLIKFSLEIRWPFLIIRELRFWNKLPEILR